MDIKYNRFAIVPTVCSKCNRTFWLEPYKRQSTERFSISGCCVLVTDICKYCCDKESEEKGSKQLVNVIVRSDLWSLLHIVVQSNFGESIKQ